MALPKKLLSIDIGNERIKIAYVSRSKSKSTLLNSIVVPTPKNCIKDGVITGKDEISGVIKNALLTEKIKEKNVVFSISSSKVITREVELPYLKPSKLKNIIKLNAVEYFPVNLDEYSLDYTITDVVETEDGKKAKIIVFAAMTSVVQMYVELAEMCKLRIQSIDYSGNSVVSFIQSEKVEGTNLFLDIGAESTMVVIMSNNVVKFSRNIMFGTKLINDSIMNHFEVDYEEATKISKERQLLNYDSNDNTYLTNDVTSGVEQILNGVSRLVDYYSSRNKNQVEKIYLIGGGSELFGIEEYVEKFFNLKTEKFVATKSVDDKSSRTNSSTAVNYAVAIGATIETINLLPANIKNRELHKARQRLPYLLIVLILVSLGGLYYMKYAELQRLEEQKVKIQAEIESMREIEAIKAEHTEVTEKEAFRRQLDAAALTRSDLLLDLMVEFERTMPELSFVKSISNSNTTVTLSFTAKDETTVAQVLTYLKDITGGSYNGEPYPLFSSVYTSAVTKIGDFETENESGYIDFSVDCTYYEVEVEQ